MSIFCPKCNHLAPYDPYFKAYVCRYCGWDEEVDIFNLDTQKIGVDWSNGVDYTAVTSMCGSCRTAFDNNLIDPKEYNIPITIYKKCPSCGIEFKKHIVIE